ncbi:Chaperone protein DnaJ [Frankliniella fusca]|uniref:Chaperone protein DnaJ n=1 Tax=Frankliniella fusca TaxID=407009 RepID=A0AAE1HT92_9NEOP|nr:Chaperone protein DnaJ [Frankliniella fusca]
MQSCRHVNIVCHAPLRGEQLRVTLRINQQVVILSIECNVSRVLCVSERVACAVCQSSVDRASRTPPACYALRNFLSLTCGTEMAENNFADIVAAVNTIAVAPEFTSIRDLHTGAKHEVRNISRISTQYGTKLKAELRLPGGDGEAIFVVLPTRLARLTDDQIVNINAMLVPCSLFIEG